MTRLIESSGNTSANLWQLLPRGTALEAALAHEGSHLLVNAELWVSHKTELLQSGKLLAVWLDSDQSAVPIADTLPQLPLIALNFPGFMDGRSYSTAVVLRKHHGYTGELRAIGDVLRDQLFYMKRCGFTSFDLKDSVKLEDAQRAFHDFSTSYASTVEEPQPLFRRRG